MEAPLQYLIITCNTIFLALNASIFDLELGNPTLSLAILILMLSDPIVLGNLVGDASFTEWTGLVLIRLDAAILRISIYVHIL